MTQHHAVGVVMNRIISKLKDAIKEKVDGLILNIQPNSIIQSKFSDEKNYLITGNPEQAVLVFFRIF